MRLFKIFELQFAILFISTTGIFSKIIHLGALEIIFYRVVFSAILLYLVLKILRIKTTIHKQDYKYLIVSGVFLGLHWITYFYSMQISTIAIGMITLFTFPIFVVFIESFLTHTPIKPISIIYTIFILIAVWIMSPEFDMSSDITIGVLIGLLSAILVAVRHTMTKHYLSHYNSFVIMKWHSFIIAICYAPYLLVHHQSFSVGYPLDWIWLLLLAIIPTMIGHSLFVGALKYFSASFASISASTQVIYGVIMGAIVIAEIPSISTIIGGCIILCVVAHQSLFMKGSK